MDKNVESQITDRIGILSDKINELERLEYDLLRGDLFNGGLFEYMNGIKIKNKFYMYSLIKNQDESFDEVHSRVIKNLFQFEYTPLKTVRDVLKILQRSLHDVCVKNNLSYWPELNTLKGIVTFSDIYPDADSITLGMPYEDIERLKELLDDNEDFRVRIQYSVNNNGYIRLYKFTMKDIDFPFIDLFSYHYADLSVMKSVNKSWADVNNLRGTFAEEARMTENTFANSPVLNDAREFVVNNYINKQKEIINYDGNRNVLFWGIENFRYGRDNIINTERIFPLQEIDLWDQKVFMPTQMDWYINVRRAKLDDMPSEVQIPAKIRKLQPSEERKLIEFIEKYKKE